MKRLRRQMRLGAVLSVVGVALLVVSLFVGTGWNIATGVCIAVSGALTWSTTRFALRAAKPDTNRDEV